MIAAPYCEACHACALASEAGTTYCHVCGSPTTTVNWALLTVAREARIWFPACGDEHLDVILAQVRKAREGHCEACGLLHAIGGPLITTIDVSRRVTPTRQSWLYASWPVTLLYGAPANRTITRVGLEALASSGEVGKKDEEAFVRIS